MSFEISAVAAVFLASLLWLFLGTIVGPKPRAIEAANANAALDRMKDWATWLTGLQTAAIAAMGLLVKGDKGSVLLSDSQRIYGFFALLFLGASIILSTWVLACLPSIQQALRPGSDVQNDVFFQRIFSHVPFRLGSFTSLAHLFCVLGVTLFGAFVYGLVGSPHPESLP